MSDTKKNKIHNPQFVTEAVPEIITESDIGRLWVDNVNKKIVIGIAGAEENSCVLTGLITDDDKNELESSISDIQSTVNVTYFSNILDTYATIEPQVNGDKHYDVGYDFFGDDNFIENSTQELDDYYSFFYIEVGSVEDVGYLRTISTDEGDKHIRPAIGADNYTYNNQNKKVVNYSKIILPFAIKGVIELKFDNKDIVEQGFELQEDKQTILIYGDPEGFFINKRVKVRYLI